MRGVRGALATVLGLSLLQLVLSSSQGSGKTAGLVSAAWQYPADILRRITDPTLPAIPDLSQSTPTKLASSTTPSSGLSGVGTPAGTGSSIIKA